MQKSVALSSCKAEVVAMTKTTKGTIRFRKLMIDLHRSHSGAVRIHHDNCDRVKVSRCDGYRPLNYPLGDCIIEEDGESSRHDHSRE
jgi:hypothetical protein